MMCRTRTFSHYLLHFFLIFITSSSSSLSTATVVDNPKMTLVQSMQEATRRMCVKSLEDSRNIKMLMRMEVKPIGPGSNMVHIAGSVMVPDLKPGTGWTDIRYKYTTSKQNELILKAWINDTELTYKPMRDMYSGRFELSVIKMYMRGRMELMDGKCQLHTPSTGEKTNQEEDKAEPEEPEPPPTSAQFPPATTKTPEVIEPVQPKPIPPARPEPTPPVQPEPRPPARPEPRPPVQPEPRPPVQPEPRPPVRPDPMPPVHNHPEPLTPVPTPREPPQSVTGIAKNDTKASNTPKAETPVQRLPPKDEAPQKPDDEASSVKDSWVSSMGYAGSIPILSIVIVAVAVSLVILISGIVIWRRRISDRKDQRVGNNHGSHFTHNTTQPLMSPAASVSNDPEATPHFNNIDAVANPIYRPKSASSPPNFYGH